MTGEGGNPVGLSGCEGEGGTPVAKTAEVAVDATCVLDSRPSTLCPLE